MKAVVAAFNQEKALVGAFSVITNLHMELFEALVPSPRSTSPAVPSRQPLLISFSTLTLLPPALLQLQLCRAQTRTDGEEIKKFNIKQSRVTWNFISLHSTASWLAPPYPYLWCSAFWYLLNIFQISMWSIWESPVLSEHPCRCASSLPVLSQH